MTSALYEKILESLFYKLATIYLNVKYVPNNIGRRMIKIVTILVDAKSANFLFAIKFLILWYVFEKFCRNLSKPINEFLRRKKRQTGEIECIGPEKLEKIQTSKYTFKP